MMETVPTFADNLLNYHTYLPVLIMWSAVIIFSSMVPFCLQQNWRVFVGGSYHAMGSCAIIKIRV